MKSLFPFTVKLYCYFIYVFFLFSFKFVCIFFFSIRRRHTSCALVTGVQTCALPISLRLVSRRPGHGHDAIRQQAGSQRQDAVVRTESHGLADADGHAAAGPLSVADRSRLALPGRPVHRHRSRPAHLRAGTFDVLGAHLADRSESRLDADRRSEEHTSELQSLMRISYAVFCLKKKSNITNVQN